MISWLQTLDTELFLTLNGSRGWILDHIMLFLTARETWIVVAVGLLGFAVYRRNKKLLLTCALLGLTAGVADFVTYKGLKPFFERKRPCYQLEEVELIASRCGGDYGFPSNHAANSMGIATAVMLYWGMKKARLLFALALVVGFTRVYLGVHFPLDVLIGWICGALYALFVWFFIWRWIEPRLERKLNQSRWFQQSS